jgi:hypothetical protein
VSGSTACTQQPQVTHVGGQAASVVPGRSNPVHGSATRSADAPDTLKASNATTNARASRRTETL